MIKTLKKGICFGCNAGSSDSTKEELKARPLTMQWYLFNGNDSPYNNHSKAYLGTCNCGMCSDGIKEYRTSLKEAGIMA